ncbi:hypothetical protein ACE7GA_14775 [Roseomonas sp. CCTCC AB2023176]|uniref:hypothetical protein n=1 Tax=Roseomonas sp. CCTCC AB2023176 TaxID=3342640 RepID=UPI0035D8479D
MLADPEGRLSPADPHPHPVRAGEPVWAAGVSGTVELPDAILPGFGRGFKARLPVLMGASGSPVLGPDGRLRGLVSALPDGGGAAAVAALTGFDFAGLLDGAARRVFVLPVRALLDAAGSAAPIAA